MHDLYVNNDDDILVERFMQEYQWALGTVTPKILGNVPREYIDQFYRSAYVPIVPDLIHAFPELEKDGEALTFEIIRLAHKYKIFLKFSYSDLDYIYFPIVEVW